MRCSPFPESGPGPVNRCAWVEAVLLGEVGFPVAKAGEDSWQAQVARETVEQWREVSRWRIDALRTSSEPICHEVKVTVILSMGARGGQGCGAGRYLGRVCSCPVGAYFYLGLFSDMFLSLKMGNGRNASVQ